MTTIEIYWDDLSDAKKNELLKRFGDNNNWDVVPIATIDIETENVEDCDT